MYRTFFENKTSLPMLTKKSFISLNQKEQTTTNNNDNIFKQKNIKNNLTNSKNLTQTTKLNKDDMFTGANIIRATIINASSSLNTSFEETTKEIEEIKKTAVLNRNYLNVKKDKNVIEVSENDELNKLDNEDVRGTINNFCDSDFHPEKASKILHEAIISNNQKIDKIITDVLLTFSNFQRQKILVAYEGMYNRRLQNDLEEEMGGFFLDALLALIQPAHIYLAQILYYSISSRSHNQNIAVEIALTSTASQLKVIRNVYQTEFHITLEKDIANKVEGLYGRMLQQLLLRTQDFSNKIDYETVNQEVDLITSMSDCNGIEKVGQNFDLFNRIFGSRSLKEIGAFLDRYDAHFSAKNENEFCSRDFETAVRKCVNLCSEIRQMFLLFARISRNIPLYFAKKLHEAFFGTRPDHASIIRILVSRSEIDLYDICDEYKRKYGYPIDMDLQATCSGDFLRLLSRLVNPTNNNNFYFELLKNS